MSRGLLNFSRINFLKIRHVQVALALSVSTACLYLVASCGQSGSGSSSSGSNSGTGINVNGSIVTQTGGQREMAGWMVALIEKDTRSARVAEVDQSGSFEFKAVDLSLYYTIVLLNSDYKLSAVLSMESTLSAKVAQYFKTKSATLPRLVHKGATVEFFSTSEFEIHTSVSNDGDSDRIPDGMETAALQLAGDNPLEARQEVDSVLALHTGERLALNSTVDSDNDGVGNNLDPDIDGDGIVNAVDADMDNDGVLNVFDADANGNGVPDVSEKNGALYFSDTIEYLSIQFLVEPQNDGTNILSLIATAKLKAGISPESVSLRGPAALLNSSVVSVVDPASGTTTSQPFDGKLLDNGQSSDGIASDRIYARRLSLATGKTPKANQLLFIQVNFGSGNSAYSKEFAYVIPSVTLGSVSASFDRSLSQMTILGTPFGSITDYYWSADIYTTSGLKVTSTPVTLGSTTMYQLATDVLTTGESYTAYVNAYSLDPVPGYPAYIIRSLSAAIR